MNSRITNTELASLFPVKASSLDTERARGVFLAALRARDAFEATGLPVFLARIGARLADWNARRRTVAELEGLTDRDLADIGLTRGDIDRIAEGDAAPRPVPAPPVRRPAIRGAAQVAAG